MFHRDRSRKDGLSPWCKACVSASARRWYVRQHPEAQPRRPKAGLPEGSHLSRTDLAYLAGLIDGEGNLDMDKSKPRLQRMVHSRYQAQIRISNTSLLMMEWLKHRMDYRGHRTIGNEELARREGLFREIRALNKVGAPAETK